MPQSHTLGTWVNGWNLSPGKFDFKLSGFQDVDGNDSLEWQLIITIEGLVDMSSVINYLRSGTNSEYCK